VWYPKRQQATSQRWTARDWWQCGDGVSTAPAVSYISCVSFTMTAMSIYSIQGTLWNISSQSSSEDKMPRKRKRSHFKPSSVQRAKTPRRSNNPDGDNESIYFEGALCTRCAELEIPKVLPSLDSKKVCTQEVSSKVLQRLVFDSPEPYVPRPVGKCTSCDCLYQNRTEPIRLRASQVYKIGMGVAESRKRYSNSWFAFWQGNKLARSTDKYSQQYFSRSGSMLGWKQTKSYKFSEIYIPLGSKLQPGTARKMLARPNYTAVKAWLDYCSQNHPKCQHLQSDALKLISMIDVDRKCLVPYPSNKEAQGDYIALSYVWGDSKIQVEKHGEIPDRLPQTIRDSIEAVRQLGKKYLWVDSICIDQSNPTEKTAQIQIMNTIYEGAFATIIALSGRSADDCLPGVGGLGKRTQQIYAEFGENLVIEEMPNLVSQVSESVWATCAWTYQEGLLSRRCLFFTEHQIYFVCNQMDCCESLNDRTGVDPLTPGSDFTAHIPHFIRDPLVDLGVFKTDRQKLELLEKFINGYTRRHLSRDDDSLNAISALLRHVQQVMFSDGFLCGLPLAKFRKSLLWYQNSGVARAVRRNASLIPS
jgi:hypothetical protein